MPLAPFHPAVGEWFSQTFAAPTRAQRLAWPEIVAGRSTLVLAPTGSGKTLAAFLCALDRLMFEPVPEKSSRCRILYVSPLRALAVDVEKNLRAPLEGIARIAKRRGDAVHPPAVALRTGDTPAEERTRQRRHPPDVLITTPESLYLVLTSEARSMLASVGTVIVDEIHALVATKRGAHLALSLERVEEMAGRRLQRVGLSATQRPLEEVARYLGGGEPGRAWRPRPVSIVDAGSRKAFDLRVEVPVGDMSRLGEVAAPGGPAAAVGEAKPRSIWPAIHPRLLELVKAHRSTIVFCNSRRLAERLAATLNGLAGEDLCRAHHGSIAREHRLAIEEALKAGRLPCIVATSSLELGIDMGAVDLVVQIETPPSVASGMQRIGRASHQAGAVSRGVIFPKFRGDLLASAAVTRAMTEGAVEATRVPRNPLDVLAQHLVSLASLGARRVDDLLVLARRAAPFATLPRAQFEGLLDMLSGRYPSDRFAELRPRLVWDRLRGTVRGREGAKRLAVANAGTIPDRGLYGVFLAGEEEAAGRARPGRRVGELDEEMVFESRVGDRFVLGASSWRIREITRDRVLVSPAPGEPGRMPFWKADRGARPADLGRAIGRLTRELLSMPRPAAHERLRGEHGLDERAADNLLQYLDEQTQATGVVPDDRTLVLERMRDELGDFRLCVLSPLGGRVHAPWALALEARLRAAGYPEVETVSNDDGIVVRLAEVDRPPDLAALLPASGEVEDLVGRALAGTALFAATFREAAARALLLPRRRPGQRTPLWMQRRRAADLLAVAAEHPSFPIVLEAYRECLQDVFDLPGLVELCRKVEARQVRLVTVDVAAASPFASSLLFGYVANYLYEGDAPVQERRAHALLVDPRQLRELIGEAELRQLLDPAVVEETERGLQGLHPDRLARSPDAVHDLLLRIGELDAEEVAARVEPASAAPAWLSGLDRERRVVRVLIAGRARLAAAEDAGRLRDALGVAPAAGLPPAFLEPVADALGQVVARYARTHGPFSRREVATRYGLEEATVERVLQSLAARGALVQGELRPGSTGLDWCDAAVLATLRRRSLARLRRQVEPAEPEALGRFLLDWHGLTKPPARSGPEVLLDVIEQLQGASFPASALEADLLPARLPGYRPHHLDALCAAGEVVWVGRGPLGDRDGRLSLYLAADLPVLRADAGLPPQGERHEAIRAHLHRRGASFFGDLLAACGGGLARGVLEALWDLVWAGEVTGDAPAALRAFLMGERARRPAGRRALAAFRSRRDSPPAGAGRWSLLEPVGRDGSPGPTERATALAEQLLARHGVLTRDAVIAEGVPGGYAALYPVLRAMEEAGRIRRGYFVSGLGGSQFAHPGALDRLRALLAAETASGEPEAQVLASTDPANPYGAALPWPRAAGGRLMRAAGTHVALLEGALVAYLGRDQADVVTLLPAAEPARARTARALARALARWASATGRFRLGWEQADGRALTDAPLAPHLAAAGFVPSGRGFRLGAPPGVTAPSDP